MTGSKSYRLMLRLLGTAIAAAVVLLPTSGCSSSNSSRGPLASVKEMLPGQKEAALRQKVEKDTFPTAQQAGIQ